MKHLNMIFAVLIITAAFMACSGGGGQSKNDPPATTGLGEADRRAQEEAARKAQQAAEEAKLCIAIRADEFEETCRNGIDDDCDGNIDCQDLPDCQADITCTEDNQNSLIIQT